MSELRNQIGQMLMVGFRGRDANECRPILRTIREQRLGGAILFDYDCAAKSPVRNIQSPEQVKQLVQDLQAAADNTPLLVAIDQEGGRVNRLKERFGFPPTLSAQELGARNELEFTRQQAAAVARTLADAGINLNLAPVVDLNSNPESPAIGKVERSFSALPERVIAHARAWIDAHHAHHVLCAPKHFPGHGSARTDSHLGFTDVTDTWTAAELLPYQQLIQEQRCDAIMTAHIFHGGLDAERPATLSRRILTGILRQQLGFDGVIMSDDMQMQAIAAHYDLETALFEAVSAGVDLLVFGNNLSECDDDIAVRAAAALRSLVEHGRVSPERIEASCQRISRLKRTFFR